VFVPVVNVWNVRMRVSEPGVQVPVAMRLCGGALARVVLVMLIVRMPVFMLQRLMHMAVLVMLRQV
jgi:hypothetical protein